MREIICNSCGSEMVSGVNVWRGKYYSSACTIPTDYTMAMVANEPKDTNNQVAIFPHHYVCPSCGEVKLVLDQKQVNLFINMVKEHEDYYCKQDKRMKEKSLKKKERKDKLKKIFGKKIGGQ